MRKRPIVPLFVALAVTVLTMFSPAGHGRIAPASATPGITTVAGGLVHSCAITDGGAVKCWGMNSAGQLGNGGIPALSDVPVDVTGLGSGVTALALGGHKTCALTSGGGVKCWGYAGYGQLGNGGGPSTKLPVDVTGLGSGVIAITAGADHACALTSGGGVKCWGRNQYGQLGTGGTMESNVPVDVVGLTSGVIAVAAGNAHTCAVTIGGGVKCWGSNSSSYVPVDVTGLGGVTAIDGGGSTCVLTNAGGVKCWGYGDIPEDVSGLASGVTAVDVGSGHACAVTSGGSVKCWGSNLYGQLGIGQPVDSSVPMVVSGLASGVASLGLGHAHTCAATVGGIVKCWGWNEYGQLGTGGPINTSVPGNVYGLTFGVAEVAPGVSQTCALSAGAVKCWGANGSGQLGNGGANTSYIPVAVVGLAGGVTAVTSGWHHTCAVNGGGLICWGFNGYGQLGNGGTTNSNVPVGVSGLASGVGAVTTGEKHSCAVTTAGGAKCWGFNGSGRLGTGGTANSNIPVNVSGLNNGVAAIDAGQSHTCALTTAGGVKCWGSNSTGQLGVGSTIDSLVPTDVGGLTTGVIAVVTGSAHTCALTTVGGVKCWGANASGQLGTGGTTDSDVPVDVSGLTSGVIAVAAGGAHTCALTSAGGAKCWGENGFGQLGNGGTGDVLAPTDVSGLGSGVVAVAAGWAHTCALMSGGGARCWGQNDIGQLGNGGTGTGTLSFIPLDVLNLPNPDTDGDSFHDADALAHTVINTDQTFDNCPGVANPSQSNEDGNFIDNLPPYGVDDKTRIDSDAFGDPCDPDSDNDGISDNVEASGAWCYTTPTNPLLQDTDGDRVLDWAECLLGFSPTSALIKPTLAQCGATAVDSDGDRLSDRLEFCYYDSNPLSNDTDGDKALDGATDGCEVASFNPDRVVNIADSGILASGIVGGALWYQPNIDVNKDGALNIADIGLVASFRSPSGQCPG